MFCLLIYLKIIVEFCSNWVQSHICHIVWHSIWYFSESDLLKWVIIITTEDSVIWKPIQINYKLVNICVLRYFIESCQNSSKQLVLSRYFWKCSCVWSFKFHEFLNFFYVLKGHTPWISFLIMSVFCNYIILSLIHYHTMTYDRCIICNLICLETN